MNCVDGGQFLIIGERLNTSRKFVRKAVAERDADFIRKEARKQAEAGAHYLDVNAGSSPSTETDDLKWLVEVTQSAVDLPLCLDSPSAAAMAAALPLVKQTPMINSITAEPERIAAVLPLAQRTGGPIIGLCLSESGMPTSVDDRLRAVEIMCNALDKAGIAHDRAYFDPCLSPIATAPDDAAAVIEAVRRIRADFGAHATCGLSNISFGLPRRNILNRTWLALSIGAGLDSAIMDPAEPHMVATIIAAQALLGRDSYCMNYIQAERAGVLARDTA